MSLLSLISGKCDDARPDPVNPVDPVYPVRPPTAMANADPPHRGLRGTNPQSLYFSRRDAEAQRMVAAKISFLWPLAAPVSKSCTLSRSG